MQHSMSFCEVITPMKYETVNYGAGKLPHLKILLAKKNSKKTFTHILQT